MDLEKIKQEALMILPIEVKSFLIILIHIFLGLQDKSI